MSEDLYVRYEREHRLREARERTFGGDRGLYGCTFAAGEGRVPELETVRRYVARWPEMREKNIGLLLWGLPGNGKTYAAACAANALIEQRVSVRMTTLAAVLGRLPTLDPAGKLALLRELSQCGLLILDDFGMERRTDYAREQIFSLVNARCLAARPLIVTTNLSLEELKNPADMSDRRIFDRLRQLCVPVCFRGESLRPAIGAEKLAVLR